MRPSGARQKSHNCRIFHAEDHDNLKWPIRGEKRVHVLTFDRIDTSTFCHCESCLLAADETPQRINDRILQKKILSLPPKARSTHKLV